MRQFDRITSRLGISIPKNARILDYGCGAGETVYALLDDGYANVAGYDLQDYLNLRDPADRSRFHISSRLESRLPFQDNTFDLILSDQVFEHVLDQVSAFRELHRIMRPGGHALHVIPARYHLIENHISVPFGNVIGHRWWFKLWATLGVRNEFQKGLSANETADRNAFYLVESLNYVPNSCYRVVWQRLGYSWKFFDQEVFDSHRRGAVRALGKVNRLLPIPGWLNRTFIRRYVYLMKLHPEPTVPAKNSTGEDRKESETSRKQPMFAEKEQ